jgi:ABC-type branched-subunit amino acid transport system substrate-binding protein
MMRVSIRIQIIGLVILLLILLLLAACNGGEDTMTPLAETQVDSQPAKDVVITIGNLTDMTGVAANGIAPINMALEDMADYYNRENLIPGIRLKVITYDQQFDPALDKPGYEWLKEHGADVIWVSLPGSVATLKSVVDRDKYVLFAAASNLDEVMPPGYVFNLGVVPQYEAYTLLTWIAENHWDYESNGPAKIGGADWANGYSEIFMDAMKDYAAEHPEQFEWEKGYVTNLKFTWQNEAEGLKDCDYVFVPTPMHIFVDQYRDAGHEATFISSDTNAAFLGMISKGGFWDEIDGMLFIRSSRWWNEEGPIIDLTNELIREYHPEKADEIIRDGSGYLVTKAAYQLFKIIADAAESVGPENLNSEALFSVAESFSLNLEGIEIASFNENKRYSTNYYAVYEARADEEDIFRMHQDWLPHVIMP